MGDLVGSRRGADRRGHVRALWMGGLMSACLLWLIMVHSFHPSSMTDAVFFPIIYLSRLIWGGCFRWGVRWDANLGVALVQSLFYALFPFWAWRGRWIPSKTAMLVAWWCLFAICGAHLCSLDALS